MSSTIGRTPTQTRSPSVTSNSRVEIVHIPSLSDGDSSKRPTGASYSIVDPPNLYLNKIAEKWMDQQGLPRKAGVAYYLSNLPKGYELYERPRPSDPNHIDRFLYGNPNGSKFFSPNEFYPHFKHLMDNNGVNKGCPCKRCGKAEPRKARPDHPASRPTERFSANAARGPAREIVKPIVAPLRPLSYTDEEETPDTIRQLIDKLRERGILDQAITESLSMDWLATKASLQEWVDKLTTQPSWVPREGEIVLFVRTIPANCKIDFDSNGKAFKLFDESRNEFIGYPQWEAGVVGQDPTEPLSLNDLIEETAKQGSVAYSGFRIEPMPEPNQGDKSASKAYKYVPMHHIRPFAFYQRILPKDLLLWHATIWSALSVISSFVLVGKRHFHGTWPNATITCSGIYIGAEFLTVGDVVRLAPQEESNNITDVLEVKAIKLKFSHLDKASNNDKDDGHPYNSMILITGKAFTFDSSRAFTRDLGRPVPAPLNEYGRIYWLHEPTKSYQVSFPLLRGRCPEASAMNVWFPGEDLGKSNFNPSLYLSVGLSGVNKARRYSTKNDTRILPGKSWLWAETRLEALDIHSMNGVDASYWDDMREERLEQDHKAARVLNRPNAKAVTDMRIAERPKMSFNEAGALVRAGQAEREMADKEDGIGEGGRDGEQRDSNGEESGEQEEQEERGSFGDSGDGEHSNPAGGGMLATLGRKRSASRAFGSPVAGEGMEDEIEDEDELGQEGDASALLQAFQETKKAKLSIEDD